MATQVYISNLALAHIACAPIQTLQDGSESARLINLHYDNCRQDVLRAFPWTFATVTANLVQTDFKLPKWRYVYAYPRKCVRIVRVFPEQLARRNDEFWAEFEASLAPDGRTRIVGTDCENAFVEYIWDVTDCNAYDSLFVEALSYKLAFEIGRSKTDDSALINEVHNKYQMTIAQAQHAAAMERQHRVDWPTRYVDYRRGGRKCREMR